MDALRWTIVIPCYNEEQYLPATLASLEAQTLRPFRLILVDNGSTDRSLAIARQWLGRQRGIEGLLLREPVPGQVHALRAGINAAASEFLAICDADTLYPPHYLAEAGRLLDAVGPQTVGFIAHDCRGNPASLRQRLRRQLYTSVVPRLLRHQAHGGGYAHLLRTDALKRAGGYDSTLWPYVLKDHELVNRLWKLGRIGYAANLYVQPSLRRADRRQVRWTLFERLLYHLTPAAMKDWFFHGFLARRFEQRGLRDTVLRHRAFAPQQAPGLSEPQEKAQ